MKRYPKKVTNEEFDNKLKNLGIEEFTKEEKEFFEKLRVNNTMAIDDYDMQNDNELFIILYQHNVDELLEICIKKLKDSWYLIQCNNMNYSEMYPGPDFFICDEFEEIEGFLGAETTLRFL